jgi:hypothetical protein
MILAAMPNQEQGRARLKTFVDEILAIVVGQYEALSSKRQRRRAIALKKADINLEEEGKRLVSYMKTNEASMNACLRRIEAIQKAERAASGPPGPGGRKGPGVGRRTAPAPEAAGPRAQRPARTNGSHAQGAAAPADTDRGVGSPPPQPPAAEPARTEEVTSASAPETPATVRTTLIDSIDWCEPAEGTPAAHGDVTPGSSGVLDLATIEAIYRRPAPDAVVPPPGDTAAAPIFTNEAKTAEPVDNEAVTVGFEAPVQGPPAACVGSPDRGAPDAATAIPPGDASGAAANADSERSPPAAASGMGDQARTNFPRPP